MMGTSSCIILIVYLLLNTCDVSAASNVTIKAYEGTSILLKCDIEFYDYPSWNGPPNFSKYTLLNSSLFNPYLNKSERMSWYRNKRDIIITNLTLPDAGTYRCYGYSTSSVYLTIYTVDLVIEGCEEILDNQYTNEGEHVTFHFNASHQTDKTSTKVYSVFLNSITPIFYVVYGHDSISIDDSLKDLEFTGNASTGDISFTLYNISTARAGVYNFKRVSFTTSSQCLTLYVLGSPTPAQITEGEEPGIGGSVIFTCSSSSATVPYYHKLVMVYTWFFNTEINPDGERFTYSETLNIFTISNVQKTDHGSFVACSANENLTNAPISVESGITTLNVLHGPESICFQPEDTIYTILTNQKIPNIICTADCYPKCAYMWTKDGHAVGEERLSLLNISRTSAGVYICTASKGDLSLEKNLTLNVIYEATVVDFYSTETPSKSTIELNEGDQLQLLCLVDSYPGASINISKSGILIQRKSNAHQAEYHLKDVKCSDSGIYVCSTRNENVSSNSTSFKSIEVYVLCYPVAVDGDEMKIFAPLSQSCTLQVTVHGYPTPTKFFWYKHTSGKWKFILPTINLYIQQKNFQSNLTIFNITNESFGEYAVRVENGIDGPLLTKTFRLYLEGIPEQPFDFHCLFRSYNVSILVEWKAGHNGGFSQVFVVQYRWQFQSIWKEYIQEENEAAYQNIHSVIIDELTKGSILIARIFSMNVKGNSSRTSSCTIFIPVLRCDISWSHLVGKTEIREKATDHEWVTPTMSHRLRESSDDKPWTYPCAVGVPKIGDGGSATETCFSVGIIAGGVVGALVLGFVLSLAALLIYKHLSTMRGKIMGISKSKKQEDTDVYYNVAEEQIAERKNGNRREVGSIQEGSQYEVLGQKSDDQQYEQIMPGTSLKKQI